MILDPDATVAQLHASMNEVAGHWQARQGEQALGSRFQTIYSVPHRRAVGHAALLQSETPGAAVDDRLSRLLHVRNYLRQRPSQGWLFLALAPQSFLAGAPQRPQLAGLVQEIERAGLPAQRLVLSASEAVLAQDQALDAAVASARQTGVLLALDAFGVGHANFDRVWRIQPEIVKLDRSLLQRAIGSGSVARTLTQMVALLHECGAMVLLDGVASEDEALLALDADADLLQGPVFGPPVSGPLDAGRVSELIDRAWQRFDARHSSSRQAHAQRLAPYAAALKKALPGLRQGHALRAAAGALLELPDVQLCYLLDEQGCELHAPVEPARRQLEPHDRRFEPLERAGHARLARRPYFRRAVAELGQVQMTRPYLSLHGARMCVTVSLAFWCQARMQVLCADLDWASRP